MGKPACSDEEFISLFKELGAPATAAHLGVAERNVYARRRRLEQSFDTTIAYGAYESSYEKRLPLEIDSGVILVGSDAHYWPGIISTAHRGLVKLTRELKPKILVMNGDVFDGARLSRHPRIGWATTPTVKRELEAVETRLTELEDACKSSTRVWTSGNHDARFENALSANTPELEGVQGFSLRDQFPRWKMALSAWVNEDTVIKHRFKGGIHATHNNTLWSGRTIVTGHLHALKVTPFNDYNGTRWGVDTGTLMDPHGPQADYTEDNPLNHRSGFVVLTYHKGMLLLPEIARVVGEGTIDFRGKLIEV